LGKEELEAPADVESFEHSVFHRDVVTPSEGCQVYEGLSHTDQCSRTVILLTGTQAIR
jgi:hypothetical protein